MPRGRIPTILDKGEFQTALTELETSNTFSNRSALWVAFCETQYAKTRIPRPLTPATALAKARDMGIDVKTPIGKRGHDKGTVVVRKGRALPDDAAAAVTKDFDKKYNGTVQKLISGSLKAAVKLKCLDCCCQQRVEVAKCTSIGCPLWNFRPYKNKNSLTPEGRKLILSGELDDEEVEIAEEPLPA